MGSLRLCSSPFKMLPLWNAAATDEPTWDPPLIELDLGSVQPDSMTTTIQAPTTTLALPPSLAASVEPSHDITMAINQQLQRALEWLLQVSPAILTTVSLHSMQKREPPSAALGAPTPSEVIEGHSKPNEEDPAIPAPMASPTQVSPQAVMPEDVPSITHMNHPPPPPTMLKIQRQPAPSPSHNSRLPQGLPSRTAREGALVAGANEHGPRAAAHNQGHYGLLW